MQQHKTMRIRVRRLVEAVFAAVILVILAYRLRTLLTRWKLPKMVTFNSTGNTHWGIGNAMFAFASTLGILHRHTDSGRSLSRRFCFDKHLQLRDAFPLLTDWPTCSASDVFELEDVEELRESSYAKYDIGLVQSLSQDRHVVLDRFMQSWKYFVDIDTELRHLFRFKDEVLQAANSSLTEAVGGKDHHDILKIGIHVRRGDMVKDQWLIDLGYVAADMSYIEHAMDYIDSRLGINSNTGLNASGHQRLFIVCSNDMSWCLDHMPAHRKQQVKFMPTQDRVVDLAILSVCQHIIITVGTFGWWAAWLANGTTVYYKDWPRQGSALSNATSHADYFPPHWIPLL